MINARVHGFRVSFLLATSVAELSSLNHLLTKVKTQFVQVALVVSITVLSSFVSTTVSSVNVGLNLSPLASTLLITSVVFAVVSVGRRVVVSLKEV